MAKKTLMDLVNEHDLLLNDPANQRKYARFEEFKVKPILKKRLNEESFAVETYVVFEYKDKFPEPVRSTMIEYRHAAALNSQAANSGSYYFLKSENK